jgi:outer membrane protein assembly factor BamB
MQRVLSVFIVAGLMAVAGCQERQSQNQTQAAKKSVAATANSDLDQASSSKSANSAASTSKSDAYSNLPKEKNDEPDNASEPVKSESAVGDANNDQPSPVDEAAPKPNSKTESTDTASDLPPPKLNLETTGTTTVAEAQRIANASNRPDDWSQWGGSPLRNNVVAAKVPTEWEVGEFDINTGDWQKDTAKNVKWGAKLGSETYGNAVVANGKVFIGTNNGAGYLKRYPADEDLGVLLCFDEKDGKFLWQDSNEKLHTGRVHDWPLLGVCSSPLVEGDRVYYVSNRGELRCLDTEGLADGENDGPITNEQEQAKKNTPDGEWEEQHEADVVWVLDMMRALGVSQHNMANSSVTVSGDYLFLLTSNGVDDAHTNLPSPYAPSFIAVDKRNGKVLWTDNTPGINVLHGQWSSPAYAVIDDVPQVIFGGGDGWLYGFDARGENGKSKVLWKFDCNPKESKYKLTGADRNHIIGTPVIHQNKVYIAVGEDPEHGEGVGHLWCIDPTKRGDVSPELVFNTKDPNTLIPHKRVQALVKEDGDLARANTNSAAVWHYSSFDKSEDGKLQFEETMHRTMGTVAIKDTFLFVIDFQGLVHCLDVNTGKPFWTHDMLAASWASPLIAGEHVYVSDEDGEITIFPLAEEPEVLAEISMGNSVYSTPIVANGVLYISNKNYLFAITDKASE